MSDNHIKVISMSGMVLENKPIKEKKATKEHSPLKELKKCKSHLFKDAYDQARQFKQTKKR
jgi:hypothetical protein